MAIQQRISTFLWFDTQAEEAAEFYISVFPNSRMLNVNRYGEGMPAPAGSVMVAGFELDGIKLLALNGGPHFKFTEAISLVVHCEGQAEIDHYWARLTEGGQPSRCGWLKDRYGLSWQVVPTNLSELMSSTEPGKAARVGAALMQMDKLDIEKLQNA